MEEKPLQVLLKKHLLSCILEGTKIKESGITVSTDRKPGEVIFFFRLDSDEGRKALQMVNDRCCDCLVFYTKEGKKSEILCFLELKGAGLNHAVNQIISAYQPIKKLLDANRIQNVILIACICMRHQSPPEMRVLAKLKPIFSRHVYTKFGTNEYKDLGTLFRKIANE